MFLNSENICYTDRDFYSFIPISGEDNKIISEMTSFEISFLLGLVKINKPKKILEVGVAAGGTTSIILSALKHFDLDSHLFSVDLNRKYYRDNKKNTGFYAIRNHVSSNNWDLILGDYLPNVINRIGRDIDMCILDTVHALPGELLDFLTVLPYLSKNAIIVLHDINLHFRMRGCFATKIVFDCAVGDKILCKDPSKLSGLPNISAIRVTCDTYKYIANSFSALTMPWSYMPIEDALVAYRNSYIECYPMGLVNYFDMAIVEQKKYLTKKNPISSVKSSSRPATKFSSILKHIVKSILPAKVIIFLKRFI